MMGFFLTSSPEYKEGERKYYHKTKALKKEKLNREDKYVYKDGDGCFID